MNPCTFEAQIIGGQLVPGELLKAFEGQRVQVTVSAPEAARSQSSDSDPEPPEDMDVEKDVYVRMPLPSKDAPNLTLVRGEALKPCLIFPEEG